MNLTHSEWDKFCSRIDAAKCLKVEDLLDVTQDQEWIAIKHDVETDVQKAYEIALIEHKHSIKATYFVQSYLLEKNHIILKKIAGLGHEVTYHYDVLDSNNGDFDKAEKEFRETIDRFEEYGFSVRTVCPHGNPLMSRVGWDSNKDFFRNSTISSKFNNIFDLVVQGGVKIASPYTYVSDAGFKFKFISDIQNNDLKLSEDVVVENLSLLNDALDKGGSFIISTHPHRWVSSNFVAWCMVTRFKVIRKLALSISRFGFIKRLMSKFYFLAKKI